MVMQCGPRGPKGEDLVVFLEKLCCLLCKENVAIREVVFLLASADTAAVQSQAARALKHLCADVAQCKLRLHGWRWALIDI
jgi:hypothetical protein